MDNETFMRTISAKADELYDQSIPGFIHSKRETYHRKGWSRLTFPSGLHCVTNSSPIEAEYQYNEVFEHNVYVLGGVTLLDNETIVDVGANIGMFTMYLLGRLNNPTIHALEPGSETFEALKENVAQFSNDNAHLYNTALGAKADSTVELVVFPNMTGNSTSHPEIKVTHRQSLSNFFNDEELKYIYTEERTTVPSTTLSAVIRDNGIEEVGLLKIDTEGAEIEVLQGIEPADWSRIRQVAIEIHTESTTLPKVTEILTAHGLTPTAHDSTRDSVGSVIITAVRAIPESTGH